MPMAGRERVKLTLVIVLSVILILVGYFRFFHGKCFFMSSSRISSSTSSPFHTKNMQRYDRPPFVWFLAFLLYIGPWHNHIVGEIDIPRED